MATIQGTEERRQRATVAGLYPVQGEDGAVLHRGPGSGSARGKRLTNRATSKPICDMVEEGDALELPRLEVEDRGKMVASGAPNKKSQEAETRARFQRMVMLRVKQAIRPGRKSCRITSSWRS